MPDQFLAKVLALLLLFMASTTTDQEERRGTVYHLPPGTQRANLGCNFGLISDQWLNFGFCGQSALTNNVMFLGNLMESIQTYGMLSVFRGIPSAM